MTVSIATLFANHIRPICAQVAMAERDAAPSGAPAMQYIVGGEGTRSR